MKNGFTLIELLSVIVILAIIAIIAVPIVLNIIDDTKKKAFEQTINGIVKSANIKSTMELKTEEILYKYENNKWGEFKLNIDGQIPKYVEIKVNKKGQTRYAITDGKYCAIKEYDSKINIKKIDNEINNKKIQEQYCKLDALLPTEESCFEYSELNNKITITDYYCYEGNDKGYDVISDVIIPERIDGKQVTVIQNNSFYYKYLTNVVIPNSVTNIGENAFRFNLLESIEIPDSITKIKGYAFANNNLTTVTISKGIKIIGDGVFSNNDLISVEIPENVTSIGYSAFRANDLTNIEIPSSVTSIGGHAFAENNLTTVTMPNIKESNLKSIEEYSFYKNKLINIIIPNSVTTIGHSAFRTNDLTNIEIPSSVTSIGGGAFSNNKLKENQAFIYDRNVDGSINYSSLNSYGGEKKDDIKIPEEVNGIRLTTINSYAFFGNKIRSVTMPSSVTKIGNHAFRENDLTSVIIPYNIKNIEEQTFYANKLTSITIPSNVTSIGDSAFSSNNLTSVIIEGKFYISDFTSYPAYSPFGWASGYNDLNITWKGSK